MAGVPRRIQADVPMPVLEGISCGVLQAELLVRLGAPKPRTGSYAALSASREAVNLDDGLAAFFKTDT